MPVYQEYWLSIFRETLVEHSQVTKLCANLPFSYPKIRIVGGADKNAVVFHKESEQVIAVLKGHTKKISGVVYHPKEVLFFFFFFLNKCRFPFD